MKATHPQRPNWLKTAYVLFLMLLCTALYEMLWAWIFAGNCCRVSVWFDMPNTITLALALATAYVVHKAATTSRIRAGLWVLIVMLLVEIPVMKYLVENQTSSLLSWYAALPLISLVGVGVLATAQKNLRSFLPFFAWGIVLALGGITFLVQSSLVFSGWGIGFEVVLLLFQAWLLWRQYMMIGKKEG